jgi:hypothetical protein
VAKDLFGDPMSVIIGPPSQDGVEFPDQSRGRLPATSSDTFPHLVPHAADALSGGLNQQLPTALSANTPIT